MPRLTGVREIWTFFCGFAICLALLVAGPLIAHHLLDDATAGTGTRALAVTVGVLALAPWWPFLAWIYRRSDEFERHSMLLGLAVAYGISVIGLAAADYLGIAGFIGWDTLPPAWELAILAWGASRLIIAIYQRFSK